MEDLEDIKKEYDQILEQLSDPELISNWGKFEELSKKKASLEKIIEKEKEFQEVKNRLEENKEIIKAQEDQDLTLLAESEIKQLKEKGDFLKEELKNLLKGDSGSVPGSVIVEIRAGTGGEEAALFVADLYRMYSKYATAKGWKQKILDSSSTTLKGLKEIVFEMKGENVWPEMKNEGGVHRVQRIPTTEKMGRVHTSTISVAILPKPKKSETKIKPDELKIDTYRASGPGGQYVNRRETAIRITHLPTGLVVTSQTERSQLQNKENALSILEARIQEFKETQDLEKMGEKRKAQIKQAKRAEKKRLYNFLKDRLTDHRIKKNWHGLEEIMNGRLQPVIESLKEIKEDI